VSTGRRWLALAGLVGCCAVAAAQQPGPAPIVVRSRGGETTVTQAGEVRRMDPSRRERGLLVARSRAGDSAFSVPEAAPAQGGEATLADLPLAPGADADFARGYERPLTTGERRAMQAYPSGVLPSGYQPASRLGERLPGNPHEPFARGYSPSSDLDRRLKEAALSSTTVWGGW
jgi:hypothetical protein